MNLTDIQTAILTAAAKRADRGLKLPSGLSRAEAEKVAADITRFGFVIEIETSGKLPVWRTARGKRYSLKITDKGVEALGIKPSSKPKDKDNRGRRGEGRGKKSSQALTTAKISQKASRPSPHHRHGKQLHTKNHLNRRTQQSGSKLALVMKLLSRKQGASIDELAKATGWQTHSVRGAMSGSLKKKLGCTIVSEKQGNTRRYRITAGPRS